MLKIWTSVKDYLLKWYYTLTIKERRNMVGAVLDNYPWDFSFALQCELANLKYMREYFKHHHLIESSNNIYEKINWAVNILELYLSEDYKELVTTDKPGFLGQPMVEVRCTKYVNIRNVDRYVEMSSCGTAKRELKNMYEKYPFELYKDKLWIMYNLIKYRYMQTWWD